MVKDPNLQTPPETPATMQEWGGYASGDSFSRPVLGLPEGMSTAEAHVLARQQASPDNQPQTVVRPLQQGNPGIITSADVPKGVEDDGTRVHQTTDGGTLNVGRTFKQDIPSFTYAEQTKATEQAPKQSRARRLANRILRRQVQR